MKNALGTVATVLLLGGRSEIGLAITARLVRDGARRVVLAQRDTDTAQVDTARADVAQAVAALKEAGADEVHTIPFDAADPGGHAAVFRAARERLGDVDVVVAAFGVLGDQVAIERDPRAAAGAAARAATVNFAGHVSTGLHAAGLLRAQGHGTLVVLSSVAGVRVRRSNFVYGAAKAGLDAFAHGLADALAGSGARVMVVRPGFVRTRMTEGQPPAPFAATPEQVAAAVAEGLRLDRLTVWVPAPLKVLFAGLRMIPRPLWRRLPR
ncbi:decaprenylphospho-beta-D-erythro-pentofuranosid-2-ulose 2-reductase [Nonomuraea sp. KM90]|uniref:decaprenylphospho-beta-D-erythro-pentofuranosid- 2-ulose 2-reductase n=1 Tax=Nonomuraea sp. KM90 TaxID=3457428 RepID=UPI003FCE4DA0